ncbi:hypothetical protein OIU78_029711 [Salix suchowensis]|nr:hypothetical protein OIU78_029711 [Salix suchowensis]
MKGAKKMERKDEALKSQVTIRCAKAAILLSSLKSFPNHHLTTSIDDQGEDKKKSVCLSLSYHSVIFNLSSRSYVFVLLELVAGNGDDEDDGERDRRLEDGIGEGAIEE